MEKTVFMPVPVPLSLEMLTRGRQKPASAHWVAGIFLKILAKQVTRYIGNLSLAHFCF